MLNNIKLYIGYWLIMLSFYPYRKVFVWDWLTLKESFKVISHPDDYEKNHHQIYLLYNMKVNYLQHYLTL